MFHGAGWSRKVAVDTVEPFPLLFLGAIGGITVFSVEENAHFLKSSPHFPNRDKHVGVIAHVRDVLIFWVLGGQRRRLNRKMEQFSSILLDSMQPPHSKEKKVGKGRKQSLRSAHQALLASLPREGEDEQRNKLELSNLQLFFWKWHPLQEGYSTVFPLIRLPQVDPAEVTLQRLLQPGFPVLSFKVRELVGFACMLLEGNSFALGMPRMQELFSVIAQHYNCVSYHNFSHAFNLMLLNSQCLDREPALALLFSDQERFCVAVAALAHDLGHSGTNNHFQVQRGSELARLSNNQAVLEHMHLRTLWRILLEHPALNFLPLLSDQSAARKAITGLILSTDMGAHQSGLANLRALKTLPLADHKWTIMEQLFHACDIGNPCLDYDNYMGWAGLLAFQFDAQTRMEEKLGLEVSRGLVYRGLNSLYCDQEWFLGSLVHPLWKEISDILPNLASFRINIQRNLERVKEETRTLCEE